MLIEKVAFVMYYKIKEKVACNGRENSCPHNGSVVIANVKCSRSPAQAN